MGDLYRGAQGRGAGRVVKDLRFIFLGTGTSAGVPVIACDCATCTSDDPRDTRLRTGAALAWTDARGQERVVLIDTTPDLRQQALREGFRRCDAILYTHNHVDHIFGLDEVRRFNAVMRAPIDIYAEDYVLDSLRRVYKHVFDKAQNVNDSFVATLIAHEMRPERSFELFGLRVTPIRFLHGRLPILGFRFDRVDGVEDSVFPLAYGTDVSGIPTETWPVLEGVRTLVLDALRERHHPTHFNLDQALSAAARIGPDRAWFIHIGHEMKHGEISARLPEGVGLAFDGLVLGE